MSVTLTPSTYQQAIYDWITEGTGSAVVVAVAGSGKTTTGIEGLRRKSRTEAAQFFAFNTAIAEELKARVASIPHVRASTFHAAGYGTLCRHLGMQRIPVMKGRSKLWGLCEDDGWLSRRQVYRYADFLVELVSLAKGEGLGAISSAAAPAWKALIDHHGLTIEGVPDDQLSAAEAEGIELARVLLERSVAAAESEFAIDFDDMLYLPLKWNLELTRTPWVLVDEAQDTNPVRRAIVERSLAPGGRLIAIGDPHQAIYGFTGASIDAIDQIAATFHTTSVPLSVCYRCARAVVEAAQVIVPEIEPAPGAIAGSVETWPTRGIARLSPQDVILCRNTAPLVRAAYWLIAQGIGCVILGKEIGEGLVRLVRRLKATSIDDLEARLAAYQAREGQRLRDKGELGQAFTLDDRCTCIRTVIQGQAPETVEELTAALTRLFEDDTTGRLTLSTIHKAKGREWPTVAILHPELMPSLWAEQPWEQQQETNLRYVAITRARERLIWLEGKLATAQQED